VQEDSAFAYSLQIPSESRFERQLSPPQVYTLVASFPANVAGESANGGWGRSGRPATEI
jgi:hypothetical protein